MSRDREKYPEKVPFRLTRMMQKAMEVTGIHGTYTMTCNDVMEVMDFSIRLSLTQNQASCHMWYHVVPCGTKVTCYPETNC